MLDTITAISISDFLAENPGSSISLRKQRMTFSVRITSPPGAPERTVVIQDEDINTAISKALESYRRGE